MLAYRNAPHSTTGESPAVRMMGRSLKTRLDQIRPNTLNKGMSDSRQKAVREFKVGDTVWARNYMGRDKWLSGVVLEQGGPLSYSVDVGGRVWKRHIDQLTSRRVSNEIECEESQQIEVPGHGPPRRELPRADHAVVPIHRDLPRADQALGHGQEQERVRPEPGELVGPAVPRADTGVEEEPSGGERQGGRPEPAPVRRSTRATKAPDKLNL